MKLAFIRCRFAVLPLLVCGLGAFASQQRGYADGGRTPDGLESADPDWLASWQGEIDRQVDEISSAYGLNDDQQMALEAELVNRLLQQQEHDVRGQDELAKLQQKMADHGVSVEDEDNPMVKEFNEKFLNWMSSMPLSDDEVVKWVDATVPSEVAREGHLRIEEIREQKRQQRIQLQFDQERTAGLKAAIGAEIRGMEAEQAHAHNRPVPTSDLGERVEAMDRLARVARNIEPTRGRPTNTDALPNNGVPQYVAPPVTHQIPQQPVVPADTKPATPTLAGPPRPVVSNPGADVSRAAPQNAKPEPPPQPAPPLDDWEKYVLSTADKYGFNDAQLTNARSILSDLRRRAYQYQASRAEAFARVELMTDAKAREAEKKALNRPLDALFAELKVRLDSLPTQSQRQKAGPAPAKR